MREPLVIHNFITRALSGEPITIMGDGRQYRNFLYVEDLARAHAMVLTDRGLNQTYNLEGSRKITIMGVAETISRVLDKAVVIEHQPERVADNTGIALSIAKIREDVGWEPTVDFEEGIRRTVEWYKKNF
jgi:UDP-glucose 4-epimerase